MSRLRWAFGGAIALVLLLVAGYCYVQRRNLPKQQAKLEKTFASDTAHYAGDTLATDAALAVDSAKPATRKAVKKERASATKAITTSRKQIKNLENQLKPGWLKVFGEVDYEMPNQKPLVEGTLSARVGVMVRVRRGTSAIGYVQQPIKGVGQRTYNIGIRQEFRIF